MKPLIAQQQMKEFDPECERHHPLLIIKAVEPGCTTELQIENATDGIVTRLTTTDNHQKDMEIFEAAIIKEFKSAWNKM